MLEVHSTTTAIPRTQQFGYLEYFGKTSADLQFYLNPNIQHRQYLLFAYSKP